MPILTFTQLNTRAVTDVAQSLAGLYEHSPWIVARALQRRPFLSLSEFKAVLVDVVERATEEEGLALICAHPDLAGKAMVKQDLTADSTHEQSQAGLTQCTPEQFERLQQLNSEYKKRFGFPFILAVRGADGKGLSREAILSIFEQRVHHSRETEYAEALRNIHRIAEIRLYDRLGMADQLPVEEVISITALKGEGE